jgi:hypothetical protein
MATAQTRRSKADDGINLYTTPEWAIDALLNVESFPGRVWEPCCGMGHISERLLARGYDVLSSDLHDHGYGTTEVNFMDYEDPSTTSVITNPPFDKRGTHMEILKHALGMPNITKVALFLPVQVLETKSRVEYFTSLTCFSKIYSFADRVKCLTKNDPALSKDNNSKHFCWLIFDKTVNQPNATLHFLCKPIPPKKTLKKDKK